MMWWWDGPHWTMMLWPLGLVVACMVAVTVAMRGWMSPPRRRDALEILKERFARGEIDRREYEDRRQVLSRS